jgi:hypothetical protein
MLSATNIAFSAASQVSALPGSVITPRFVCTLTTLSRTACRDSGAATLGVDVNAERFEQNAVPPIAATRTVERANFVPRFISFPPANLSKDQGSKPCTIFNPWSSSLSKDKMCEEFSACRKAGKILPGAFVL